MTPTNLKNYCYIENYPYGTLPDAKSTTSKEQHDLEALFQSLLRDKRIMLPKEKEQDLETFFSKELQRAKQEANFEEQVIHLVNLGDLYLSKKDWINAAKLMNCAVAILKKNSNNHDLEQFLFYRLEKIQDQYLESRGICTGYQHHGRVASYRAWLKRIRSTYIEHHEQNLRVSKLLGDLTIAYRELLTALILDSQKLIGSPPVKWACLGLGSMARYEMCPYSDIEFAFLIEEETAESLHYFHLLTELIELKIINLGETKFPIFGASEESPTPSGFCSDGGGLTPSGCKGYYQLIGTPQNLAQFQEQKWVDANIILSNVMGSVCLVTGDKDLFEKYQMKKNAILDEKITFFDKPHRKSFALHLLKGHLTEFSPDLFQEREALGAFGIKKEFYQPIQEVIASLALFYNIKAINTFIRIDELSKIAVFSAEGASNLKEAVARVLTLRVEAHLFYLENRDLLFRPERNTSLAYLMYFNTHHIKTLKKIYQTIISLHSSVKQFLISQDKNAFNSSCFYDEHSQECGFAFDKELQYSKAQEAAFQEAVLNSLYNLPLEFAISSEQNIPEDIEGYYCKELIEAKKKEAYEEQFFFLVKLSDLYLKKENWPQACKILNCALAIAETNRKNNLHIKYLLDKLERIEIVFLIKQQIPFSPKYIKSIMQYRDTLHDIRVQHLQDYYQAGSSTIQVMRSLTNSYKKLLATLLLESEKILGPPPTTWACIGMGSMARGEMCLYSDLEFAFLIKEKNEKSLLYFRTLAQWMELRIVNFGETKFPIFEKLFGSAKASPTRGGFSMDTGGNTPLGKPGSFELIDTPEGLSQFQTEEWMENDLITANAICTVCYIAGDKQLVDKYNQEKKSRLNATDGFFSVSNAPFRKKLALHLLKGHLIEYNPDLSHIKTKEGAFGIKQELYRPFQETINCLSIFYDVTETHTIERVNALVNIGLFSPTAGENINKVIEYILTIRFAAHDFYKNEYEILCHPVLGKKNEPDLFYLLDTGIPMLTEIYKVLIPFCQIFKQFYIKQSKDEVYQNSFYDTQIGETKQEQIQWNYAIAQQALALNPKNIQALALLSEYYLEFDNLEEALVYTNKAYSLISEDGESQSSVKTHLLFGNIFFQSKKYEEAMDKYSMALTTAKDVYGQSHHVLAFCMLKTAQCQLVLRQPENALESYQGAYKIYLDKYGEESSGVMSCHSGTALVFEGLNNWQQAGLFHEKAANIAKKFRFSFEDEIPVSETFVAYGNFVYRVVQNYQFAFEYYQEALHVEFQKLNRSKPHPRIADKHSRIAFTLEKLDRTQEAEEHHKTALRILTHLYGKTHPKILDYRKSNPCLRRIGS